MCLFSPQNKGPCGHEECEDFNGIIRRPGQGVSQTQNGSTLGKRRADDHLQEVNDQQTSDQTASNYQTAATETTVGEENVCGGALEAFGSVSKGTLMQSTKVSKISVKPNPGTKPFTTPRVGLPSHSLNGESERGNGYSQTVFPNMNSIGGSVSALALDGLLKGSRPFQFKDNANVPSGAFQIYGGSGLSKSEESSDAWITILNEVRNNSRMILELAEKVDLHNKMLSILMKGHQHIRTDRQITNGKIDEPIEAGEQFYHLIGKGPDETISKTDLLLFLKEPHIDYRYRLELLEPIQLPLVKERNFALSLRLVSNRGHHVLNSNKILLSVNLYTSDNPPTKLKRNTLGTDILKGHKDNFLMDGRCTISKLQVKEVTSHYRSGTVFLVIAPHKRNFNPILVEDKNFVEFKYIEPLVIEDVKVKAKLPKKAEEANSGN